MNFVNVNICCKYLWWLFIFFSEIPFPGQAKSYLFPTTHLDFFKSEFHSCQPLWRYEKFICNQECQKDTPEKVNCTILALINPFKIFLINNQKKENIHKKKKKKTCRI